MKSHDQETKTLFAIVGIAIGICGACTFFSKIYDQVLRADSNGLLIIAIIVLGLWVYALSSGLDSFEKKIKGHIAEKFGEFSKRLDERERQVSWLKHAESNAKDERARIQRWLDALSQDIRQLKANHKKLSAPPSEAIEEAIREITTEVTE